ncbi:MULTISPECIES: hypothetical protein [unclassified Providencia]|uniref:hypothetical protein n=1 Tax=unclassified Providencia TaxID=2633465 RepID=UPI0023494AB3|nr:hypothetical protein [Providencia sp. PROV131]
MSKSNSKLFKLASYSSISKFLKAISAPIVLLVIGKKLSIEEISFYFTFFNLIAMQQLAELGIGHVIKLSIAHSFYKIESQRHQKIKSYFLFSIAWFLGMSLFILIFVGYGGVIFYSSYTGEIDWFFPWWCLVLTTAFISLLTPIQLFLEGAQKQLELYKAQAISSTINPIVICVSLYLNFGLYSIFLGLLISNIVLYLLLLSPFLNLLRSFNRIVIGFSLKKIFSELWPLLSKVSIVWGLGFIFWNGFNLIIFKVLDPINAGKIIFTFTLAKAGFSIAESFTQSHMTLYSAQLSQKKFKLTYNSFSKYRKFSLMILIIGYVLFIALELVFPSFYIFEKVTNINISVQIFIFFILLLWLTVNNNFIRCFKTEPFALVSMYHSLLCPIAFYLSCIYFPNYLFVLCSIIILGSILWSRRIARDFILVCK